MYAPITPSPTATASAPSVLPNETGDGSAAGAAKVLHGVDLDVISLDLQDAPPSHPLDFRGARRAERAAASWNARSNAACFDFS